LAPRLVREPLSLPLEQADDCSRLAGTVVQARSCELRPHPGDQAVDLVAEPGAAASPIARRRPHRGAPRRVARTAIAAARRTDAIRARRTRNIQDIPRLSQRTHSALFAGNVCAREVP